MPPVWPRATKKTFPFTLIMDGPIGPIPIQTASTSTVPSAVVSVRHNCLPLAPSSAAKNPIPPTSTTRLGNESAAKLSAGLMSLTSLACSSGASDRPGLRKIVVSRIEMAAPILIPGRRVNFTLPPRDA